MNSLSTSRTGSLRLIQFSEKNTNSETGEALANFSARGQELQFKTQAFIRDISDLNSLFQSKVIKFSSDTKL